MAESILTFVYLTATYILFAYAFQCYVMVGLFLRRIKKGKKENQQIFSQSLKILKEHDYPKVLTQIPLFNEANVAERIIRAAAALDYPKDRHEIQILDDSTDETLALTRRIASELSQKGHNIRVVRRPERTGYKAGALAYGLKETDAEFCVIFDSDFVPKQDYLKQTIPFFLEKPELGIVQARWGHLNENYSLLTRAQAIGIDGHFMVEQCARAYNGLFMNFNGTAGVWRIKTIEDAGGWSARTLTEDIDLSYRAQLAGWKAHYLPEVVAPAEIPEEISAFRSQQFRWAKGSMQTALRLLPTIFRSKVSLLEKYTAFFHLTHYGIHPLMLLVAILALPMLLFANLEFSPIGNWILGLAILATMTAPNTVYAVSQKAIHADWLSRLRYFPAVVCIGIGLALSNTRAVLEALFGVESGFIRTPKRGDRAKKNYKIQTCYISYAEIILAIYCTISLIVYLQAGKWLIGPFLFLYAVGFGYIGIKGLLETPACQIRKEDPELANVEG